MSRKTLIALCACLLSVGACKTGSGSTQSSVSGAVDTMNPSSAWKSLFDGKSTAGWRNYKKQTVGPGWTVVDGILTRSGDDAGDIMTVDKYKNFELALDWRISEGGNSGILYRATEDNEYIWQSAPEMQILDNERHNDGKLELTSAGSDFALYPAPHSATHPAGQWNSVRLIVNGNHVEHWMNGQKVVEYELGSADWTARVAASKFKTMPNYGKAGEGYIGLQDHGDKVEFRNIRVRVLP